MRRPAWSIRALLFAMIAVATVPPIVIGLWQIRSAGRVGRSLLASQLDRELGEVALAVHTRWTYREGALLLLAGNEVARTVLAAESPTSSDVAFLRDLASKLDGVDHAALVRTDRAHTVSITGERDGSSDERSIRSGVFPVTMPVSDERGTHLGNLEAAVSLTQILPPRASASTPPLLAAFDSSGRLPLATPPIPAELFRADEFGWNEQRWLVRRRAVGVPAMQLVLAAPLDPFVLPFQRAATERTLWLVLGSIVALALASLLASHLSTSVRHLAFAADDIARGNFERRIVANGSAEVSRLAGSFNAMTGALETTQRRLAERASLAAVGEFAASLAHEIRNPLTAVRVDLQHLARHAALRLKDQEALERALRQVARLDRTVSAALELARGGDVRLTATALEPIVRDAIAAAAPEAAVRDAEILYAPPAGGTVVVLADGGAVHQMLLNLLLNAVQALDSEGGRVSVGVSAQGGRAVVTIADNGRGIPLEQLPRVFDPFYTTRPGGNGLGLAVARRIAVSHGGEIAFEAAQPRGTIATVTLQLVLSSRAEPRSGEVEGSPSSR